MNSLSNCDESVVRIELMEQVPQIAMLCHEFPDKLGNIVPSKLLPMVVKYLTDPHNQVRKTSQAALLVLLEQDLVARGDVYSQVCPVILELTEPDAMDDFRTEAVAFMSKMAPLIGRDMTERLFVEKFKRLCTDTVFQVRKVCASNFGDITSVVGFESTQEELLSRFVCLCEDGVWGVRKACAEVFMAVSCSCPLGIRKEKLSPVFVSLLTDQSRWVRVAAFQNLGPFISTFADPSVTGLHYNEEGALVIGTPKDAASAPELNADNVMVQDNNNSTETTYTPEQQNIHSSENQPSDFTYVDDLIKLKLPLFWTKSNNNTLCTSSPFDNPPPAVEMQPLGDSVNKESLSEGDQLSLEMLNISGKEHTSDQPLTVSGDDHHLHLHYDQPNQEADNPNFNELNFWRIPLPHLELDIDILEETTNVRVKATVEDEDHTSFHSQVSLTVANSQGTTGISVSSSKHIVHEPKSNLEKLETTEEDAEIATNICEETKSSEESESINNNVDTNANTDDTSKEDIDDLAPQVDQPAVNLTDAVKAGSSDQNEDEDVDVVNFEEDEKEVEGSKCDEAEKEVEETGTVDVNTCDDAKMEQSDDTLQQEITIESNKPDEDVEKDDEQQEQSTYAQVCASSIKSPTDEAPFPNPTADNAESVRFNENGAKFLRHNLTSDKCPEDVKFDCINDPLGVWPNWYEIPYWMSREKKNETLQGTKDLSFIVNQDIVPKTLLEHYISMTDPLRAETVDNEITRHCAYSLPAVALTLGRRNWPVLKNTYVTLASDMHWKVRRTLAFSIHELAVILGEDLAQRDLLPVFEGFIKDLDEVRIGVLKHLTHFLRLLSITRRREYLPRLCEFLRSDNDNNWRFRLELTLQLSPMVDLFTPEECFRYICPVALALLADKVVHIRRTCYSVISKLARQLFSEDNQLYLVRFSTDLQKQFALEQTWTKRQSYAFVCGELVSDVAIPLIWWCELFLPDLLLLASDKVPNIRIAVAKTLQSNLINLEYFQNVENEATHYVNEALEKLRNDSDRDVKHFASPYSNTQMYLDPQDPNL